MKDYVRISLAFLLGALVICSLSPEIQAKTTRLSLSFDADELTFKKAGDFDQILFRDSEFLGRPGEPLLPVKVIQILIPVDQEIESAKMVSERSHLLAGTYNVYPTQPPVPVSEMPWRDKSIEFVPPDPQIYGSSSEFPGKVVDVISHGFMGGLHIAALAVYPVQYLPTQGKLLFYDQIELELIYQPSDRRPVEVSHRSETASQIYSEAVKSLVINPEEAELTPQRVSSSTQEPDVEYLIITTDDFAATFQELADWKTAKGVPAEIYTVEWISSNYSGVDTQEKIRYFIRDMYQNQGTVWVLLGGDVSKVPHRKGFAFAETGTWLDEIPADLYYSDLDSNWNANGDTIWGGFGDQVDFYPDVFVGRAPVDNLSQLLNFIDKTLEYQITPPTDYQLNILLTGEVLWWDPYTAGGLLKEAIDLLYIPARFDSNITRLYESEGTLNFTSFSTALNSGQNIVNHYGHGNTSGFSIGPNWWSSSSMGSLINSPRHSILYTVSCLSNAFDVSDCCGEYFINNSNGGGVAYIGNSRYGWGVPGSPSGGPGPRLDMRFFAELFQFDHYRVGVTLAESKAHYVPSAQSDRYYKWTLYALNLLGDPELPIWTNPPGELEVAHIDKILPGINEVEVVVENGGTPMEQALVCLSKNPHVYSREMTSEEGTALCSFETPDTGQISVVVTAKDFLPYQGTIQVVAFFPGDSNGDGIVSLVDVVFMINYLFKGGEQSNPWERSDVNCDTEVNLADVVYLINYLFTGGSEPCS